MVRFQLTIDCADRGRQARFWAQALGYRPQVEDTVERLASLGAMVLRVSESEDYYTVVMQDPEGNEFCVA